MSLIRISESDDWIVDYDRERGMYRVSYFEDGHYKDEYWFDCFEEREIDNRIEKIIEKLECLKINFKEFLLKRNKYLDTNSMENFFDKLIYWIKEL